MVDALRIDSPPAEVGEGQQQYVYGVMEAEADTRTDVDRHIVLVTNIQRDMRFPTVSDEEATRLASIVEVVMPRRETVTVPLDLVLAYVRSSSAQQREVEVNFAPPRIFYSTRSAILVMIMGEPQLKPVEGTSLMFAINTNWDVFYDAESSRYFLLNGESWLSTTDPLKGPWAAVKRVPIRQRNLRS